MSVSMVYILYKVMDSNLIPHLNISYILFKLQHCFLEKHSLETQLIQLSENMGMQLKVCYQVNLELSYFSMGSEKVIHLKLIFKLTTHCQRKIFFSGSAHFSAVVLEGGVLQMYLCYQAFLKSQYLAHFSYCST